MIALPPLCLLCECAHCVPVHRPHTQKVDGQKLEFTTDLRICGHRTTVCARENAMRASVIDDHFLHIGYAWRFPHTRNANNGVGRLAYRMAG